MAFCEGSSIAKKLRGFADAQAQAARGDDGAHAERGSLHGVIRVLEALTGNVDADARVLIHIEQTPTGATTLPATPSASGSWLKVLHLNPAVHFSRLLSEAHAVILAGGTMQPFADLEQQIFRELPTGRLQVPSPSGTSCRRRICCRSLCPLARAACHCSSTLRQGPRSK